MKVSTLAILAAINGLAIGSPSSLPRGQSAATDIRAVVTTETCGSTTDLVPLFQMYHTPKTVHFYAIENSRVTNAINDLYAFNGVAALIFPTQEPSTVPFFCLINAVKTAFFYTTSETERDSARTSGGYSDYSTAGYIYPNQVCGSVPLYRLHFVAANTDYIYTISTAERDNAVNNLGFTYEGIAGYVLELASGVTIA